MLVTGLVSLVMLVSPIPPPVAGGGGSHTPPTPAAVAVVGGRSVSVRGESGGLTRLTYIPSASQFAQYRGGVRQTCSITADRDGFVLSNGDVVDRGTVVTSHYVFVEGIAIPFDLPPAVLPDDVAHVGSRGPLVDAMRTFTVFCDGTYYDINQRGLIEVPFLDVSFTPLARLDQLRNDLQLDRPVVFENPVVGRFGGLVTRYPVWLAIGDEVWRQEVSNPQEYRGATLELITVPRELEFDVEFVPNPAKPSPAFSGVVSCVPGAGISASGVGGVMPALPVLPEQTTPGVNGPCMWTPPGPGRVTFTARITYTVTFRVDGYTMPDDDHVWESVPTEFVTGELIAVNTKP